MKASSLQTRCPENTILLQTNNGLLLQCHSSLSEFFESFTWEVLSCCYYGYMAIEFFPNYKNLTFLAFLYKLDIKGFQNQQKVKLPPVRIILTTLIIYPLYHPECVEEKILKLNLFSCTTSLFRLRSFLDSIKYDFIWI